MFKTFFVSLIGRLRARKKKNTNATKKRNQELWDRLAPRYRLVVARVPLDLVSYLDLWRSTNGEAGGMELDAEDAAIGRRFELVVFCCKNEKDGLGNQQSLIDLQSTYYSLVTARRLLEDAIKEHMALLQEASSFAEKTDYREMFKCGVPLHQALQSVVDLLQNSQPRRLAAPTVPQNILDLREKLQQKRLTDLSRVA